MHWDFRLQASMTACPSLQMSHLCRVWDRISFRRCRPPSVYTYGGRQLPPTCGRMGDAEPRFSNLFALQLTTFLFPYKLGFVFISLLLYSKRRAFLPSAQPKVYDCRLFVCLFVFSALSPLKFGIIEKLTSSGKIDFLRKS